MTPPTAAPGTTSRKVRSRLAIAGIVAVLAVVFIVQNRDRARVNFFTVDVSGPLWLTLTVMTLLGLGVGLLIGRRR